MYSTIFSMLNNASLSAFSITPGAPQNLRPGAILPVRDLTNTMVNGQPNTSQQASPQAQPSSQPGQPFSLPPLPPGQVLPRGSLLNLSV
jgi:hypothetical protein